MVTLISLNVSYNELISVPQQLQQLTRLSYLNIAGNRLTSLPMELLDTENIRTFQMDHNPWTAVYMDRHVLSLTCVGIYSTIST